MTAQKYNDKDALALLRQLPVSPKTREKYGIRIGYALDWGKVDPFYMTPGDFHEPWEAHED